MTSRCAVTLIAALLISASPALAQNWSFDARRIAMGAVGGSENLASKMIEEQSEYRSIVLPFGLIQVLRDLDVFNPDSERFDIVRSIEYAAAPLHYVLGRDNSDSGREFVVDIRNAELSRDLNTYKGFVPANQPVAEGLAAPNYGGTIKVHRGAGGGFQGIYIGAGPYLAMRTELAIDPDLIQVLGSENNVYLPNTRFDSANMTRGQAALAITGGYRGRFTVPALTDDRDGIYVAANYNYLRGFRYEDTNTALRLDTDNAGLLTVNLAAASPLLITRDSATSGTGRAIDLGIGLVAGPWEGGFGINGIGNRIDWKDVEQRRYSLGNIFFGDSEFDESNTVLIGDRRVELPVDYRAHGGYRSDRWAAVAEYGHGFQGTSFRAGGEIGVGAIDFRGGGIYSREQWAPTVGIGLNMGDRVGLDLAAYGTSANAERERRTAIAVSLRINH